MSQLALMATHHLGRIRAARSLTLAMDGGSGVGVPVRGLLVIFVPLAGVVHLYLPAQNHLSLHFQHGALAFLFVRELYETVALGNARHGVADDLGLDDRLVNLFERLQEHRVRDFAVKIAHVHLVFTRWLELSLSRRLVRMSSGHTATV